MKNRQLALFFLITALEGLAALAVYIARVGALSTARLAAGGLAGLAAAGLLALGIGILLRPGWAAAMVQRALTWLEQGGRATQLVVSLVFLAVVIISVIALFSSRAANSYDSYAGLFNDLKGIARFENARNQVAAVAPLLAWLALALLQTAAALWLELRRAARWSWPAAGISLLVLLLVAATLAHWVILRYEVRLLVNLPGWYWQAGERQTSGSGWIFTGLAVLSAGAVVLVLKKPERVWLNLLALVVLGYAIQVGFGFLDGRGYEYVRLKYAGTLHRSYAMRASSSSANALRAIRNYEELYKDAMFPSTKPPGVMVFYILTGKLVNAFDPQSSTQARFDALTGFAAVVFPLISFLVLIVIYRLGRGFLDQRSAYFPAVLYLFAPNIILLPLFLDQVLYPLLFSLGLLLTMLAVRSRKFWAGVALGAALYLAAFFSFSMLPLIPFSLLYIALEAFLRRKERPWWSQARMLAGILAGMAVLFVAFWLAFNYDVITRYQNAMAVVHYYDYFERAGATETGSYARGFFPSLGERLSALWLNNLDFAAATGFPLYLLFLLGGIRSLVELARGKIRAAELLLPVIFITFVAMNLYGQNRGESARLWMFWVPGVVLLAGREIILLFKQRGLALGVLALAQLITILLTFKFQDFWM